MFVNLKFGFAQSGSGGVLRCLTNLACARLLRPVRRRESSARRFRSVTQTSRGKTRNPPHADAGFIKHPPLGEWRTWPVTCSLVPSVPHLVSGSCSSPRAFALGFLPTPPRGDAVALSLTFGFSSTWRGDLHPTSYVPCPAHTLAVRRRYSVASTALLQTELS